MRPIKTPSTPSTARMSPARNQTDRIRLVQPGTVKVKVAKQRNGPLGDFYLRADMAHMRFTPTEYSPPVAEFRPRSRGFGGGSRRCGNDE